VFATSRLTASSLKRQTGIAAGAGICCVLLSLSATPALADTSAPEGCGAQSFSQQFAAYNDFNWYKLVHGGEFNSSSEGWVLRGGAKISEATRPDGTTGGVLDMPSGAQAISPPVGVNLQDRTARVWVRDVKGAAGVDARVAYPYTSTWLEPQDVGHVHGQHASWTLSTPINVDPQIAGAKEGFRIVRFVFNADSKNSDTQLFGLWVDPRMREESAMACGPGGTTVRGAPGGESLPGREFPELGIG